MNRLLFSIKPEINELPTHQLVNLVVLLALGVVSLAVVPYEFLLDLPGGDLLPLVTEGVYLAFVISALGVFFVTRSVRQANIFLATGIGILAVYLVWSAGGPRGLGFFYFLSTFPVLYFILGYRGGMAFIGLYFAGIVLRVFWGHLPVHSLFADPDSSLECLVIIAVSSVLGFIGLGYEHHLVNGLADIAYKDPTTGLASRPRMAEFLQQSLKEGRNFTLVGIRLNQFAQVSNHRGVAAGDQALAKVGQILREKVPPGATAGRWAGTVFVVRIPGNFESALVHWTREVLADLTTPIEIADAPMTLNAGAAITRFPADGRTLDRLMANLTTTLDQGEGGNSTVRLFNEALWSGEERKFRISAALKGALDRKEFSVVYQPKVRMTDGTYYGAEVLLRWTSAELGPVSPSEFIPIAEEYGMIRQITEFVLYRFVEEFPQIIPALPRVPGQGYRHGINLSPMDLTRRELAAWISSVLASRGMGPSDLELEITEGMMMSSDPQVRRSLEELKTAGFRLAIDDFGTGYSSLSYLHRINADSLKIDQSFVRQVGAVSTLAPIIDAVISLGRALGMEVIAEGVETQAQAEYLLARGCELAQGWLYAIPMALADYLIWLQDLNR